MTSTDLRDSTRPINGALLRTTWAPLIQSQPGVDWYGSLLTRVVLLVAGEPVQYATGDLQTDGLGPFVGTIAVFTPTRVVTADVSGAALEEPTSSTVRTYPRSSLSELQVEATGDVFADARVYSWPGTIVVTALYANSDALRIPGSNGSTSGEQDRVRELLTALIADVTPES